MSAHDIYKRISLPSGHTLKPCPACGAKAELWQFSEHPEGSASRVVMCSNRTAFGPQIADEDVIPGGCLLYMPPEAFYRPRIIEAVKYWNEYADALIELRVGSEHRLCDEE